MFNFGIYRLSRKESSVGSRSLTPGWPSGHYSLFPEQTGKGNAVSWCPALCGINEIFLGLQRNIVWDVVNPYDGGGQNAIRVEGLKFIIRKPVHGGGWIHESQRGLENTYFFRLCFSSVGVSVGFGIEIVGPRRDCSFSSGMGIRGSHSSTNPAVPRLPHVDRLMVEFFLRPVTMRTFSMLWKVNRIVVW